MSNLEVRWRVEVAHKHIPVGEGKDISTEEEGGREEKSDCCHPILGSIATDYLGEPPLVKKRRRYFTGEPHEAKQDTDAISQEKAKTDCHKEMMEGEEEEFHAALKSEHAYYISDHVPDRYCEGYAAYPRNGGNWVDP